VTDGQRSIDEYIPPREPRRSGKEALKLPVGERARLAEILLESLDTLSEDEHQQLWAEEAARRDAELDADPSMGRPADEVFRDANARLR
jgi:putative addiction module component (TIGR02574 family)